MATVHVFDYLDAPEQYRPPAVCAAFGDEPFLRRLAILQLRRGLAGESDDVSFQSFDGEDAEWRDVIDELSSFSLFGGGSRKLVLVDNAGDFVTAHRARLEDYVEKPKRTAVLVLAVDAWPANTRLYKSLDKSGLQIECRPPEKSLGRRKVLDESRLQRWLEAWSFRRHDARLAADAARTLLDLVGPQFGLLDQELAKLALFAGPGGGITAAMVKDVVGGWRTKTVWEFLDAVLDGNAAEALRQLDRMLQSGEHPLALLGPISPALRRFAAATRIYERAEKQGQPVSLRESLLQAGVPNWPKAIETAERQLKQLGRQRAGALFGWLLDADLAIKGSHSSPERARFVLERLVFRLAGPDRMTSRR